MFLFGVSCGGGHEDRTVGIQEVAQVDKVLVVVVQSRVTTPAGDLEEHHGAKDICQVDARLIVGGDLFAEFVVFVEDHFTAGKQGA